MRRLLPLIMILMAAPAANAGGLVHKMSSSVQLTVDSARTTATRLGYAAGVAGDLAGTIATDGGISITAGGAGSTAVGQFVSEITVID
jgi:hypothetical protein